MRIAGRGRRGLFLSRVAARLLAVFRPYRWRIVGAALTLPMVAGALLTMGRGLAYLVDEGLGREDPKLLNGAVIATAVIAFVPAAGSYLRTTLVNQIGESVLADLRRAVFGHLMTLPPAWYQSARTGGVLARITTNPAIVQTVMTSTLPTAAHNVILLIGGLVIVVLSSAKMSLVVLVVVPLVVIPLIILGRRLRKASPIAQDRLADVAVQAEETVAAIRTVQAFGWQGMMASWFETAVDDRLEAALRRVRLRGWMSGIIILLVFSGMAAILCIGGQDLIAGRISAGDLSSFVFYAFLVAASTGFLSELAGGLQQAAGAAERIVQRLQRAADLSEPAAPLPLRRDCKTACRFEAVDFSYPAGTSRPAVSAVDFEISRGQRVALVGPSRTGKSTLFHLLLRFYDPGSGTVRLCGEDLRDLALGNIRQYIGLAPQEPALFSTNVRDNICFGRPDADEIIAALENGYNTPVGEKGARLSGGQRQRIAVARAILRTPGLLPPDEATSALDARSEATLQAALERLMRDRTSIVIAHRLATVVRADRIFLMDGGRITATGTHEQLINESALYRHLADLQFSTP